MAAPSRGTRAREICLALWLCCGLLLVAPPLSALGLSGNVRLWTGPQETDGIGQSQTDRGRRLEWRTIDIGEELLGGLGGELGRIQILAPGVVGVDLGGEVRRFQVGKGQQEIGQIPLGVDTQTGLTRTIRRCAR